MQVTFIDNENKEVEKIVLTDEILNDDDLLEKESDKLDKYDEMGVKKLELFFSDETTFDEVRDVSEINFENVKSVVFYLK